MGRTTRNQQPSSNTEKKREEAREAGRGAAAKATVCLGFLSPRRDRQVHHHTHAPLTKFTNPPEAQKFPREEKSRPKSGAPNPFAPKALAPPSPSRIPQIPAEIPQSSAVAAGSPRPTHLTSQPPPRISAPRVSSPSLAAAALTNCPDRPVIGDLLGAGRPGAPSAEIPSRREAATPRPLPLAAPTLCWYLSGVGGGDPPGRGSIPFRSVVLILRRGRSICKGARAVLFPQSDSGGSVEPPCPTLSPPLVVVD